MPMNPLRGHGPADAPEEVVGQLVDAGLLERGDLAALRIEAPHHVADRAVLAGGVHALQHQQQRAAVLGIEPVAEVGQHGDVLVEFGLGLLLVLDAAGVVGVEIARAGSSCPARRKAAVSWQWTFREIGPLEG